MVMKFKLRNFSILMFFLFMSFASVLGFSQFNAEGLGRIVEKKVAKKLQGYKEVALHGFVPFSKIDLSQYAFCYLPLQGKIFLYQL